MKLSALPVPAQYFSPAYFTNPFGPPNHYGFDIGFGQGMSVPIYAARSGEVLVVDADGDYNGGYGNYIVIWHDAVKTSTGLWKATQFTLYAHLASANVQPGQHVESGQKIGMSGNTGNSTGPHLHFQVQETKTPVPARPVETSGTCLDPYPLLTALEAETPPAPPPAPGPLVIPGPLKVKASATPYVNMRAAPVIPKKTEKDNVIGKVLPGQTVETVSVDPAGWIKVVTYAYVKQDYFDNA